MLFWPKSGSCCCGEGGEECGTLAVTVRFCSDDSPASGAVVTVYDPSEAVVGTLTTDGSGVVTFDIPAAAAYRIHVEKTGYTTLDYPFAATCTANNLTIRLRVPGLTSVAGCGCALPGATVSITQTAGGSYSGSATTDAGGQVRLWFPPEIGNSFDWSISAPDYITAAGSFAIAVLSCTLQVPDATLLSDPDLFCFGGNPPYCRDAIPASLTLTIAGGVHAGTYSAPYIGESTAGYLFRACVNISGFGSDSSAYELTISGQWYIGIGSAQGCNDPGHVMGIVRWGGLTPCAGTINSTVAPTFDSGTGACPVACVFTVGGFTPNTYTWSE